VRTALIKNDKRKGTSGVPDTPFNYLADVRKNIDAPPAISERLAVAAVYYNSQSEVTIVIIDASDWLSRQAFATTIAFATQL